MQQKIFLVVEFFKIPFRILLSPVDDFLYNAIELRNIYLKSHIQYLSESGILISQDSSAEKNRNVVFVGMANEKYNKKDKLFKKLIPSVFNKNYIILDPDMSSKENGGIKDRILSNQESLSFMPFFHSKQNFFSIPVSGTAAKSHLDLENSANDYLNNDEADNVISGPLKFVTSKSNFYLLKFFVPTDKKLTILMEYSEGAKTPISVQVFLHLPILITSVIVILLILTFESDVDKNIIAKEIEKLPVQKYNHNIACKECPICLEGFLLNDEIKILNCMHCFHKSCIDMWLFNLLKCPLCRNSVSKLADSPSYEIYQTMNSI